jgi:hypothetical protein
MGGGVHEDFWGQDKIIFFWSGEGSELKFGIAAFTI